MSNGADIDELLRDLDANSRDAEATRLSSSLEGHDSIADYVGALGRCAAASGASLLALSFPSMACFFHASAVSAKCTPAFVELIRLATALMVQADPVDALRKCCWVLRSQAAHRFGGVNAEHDEAAREELDQLAEGAERMSARTGEHVLVVWQQQDAGLRANFGCVNPQAFSEQLQLLYAVAHSVQIDAPGRTADIAQQLTGTEAAAEWMSSAERLMEAEK